MYALATEKHTAHKMTKPAAIAIRWRAPFVKTIAMAVGTRNIGTIMYFENIFE
jgi:hypothetical protein